MKRACAHCGEGFETRAPRARYCGDECRRAVQQGIKHTLSDDCGTCGHARAEHFANRGRCGMMCGCFHFRYRREHGDGAPMKPTTKPVRRSTSP